MIVKLQFSDNFAENVSNGRIKYDVWFLTPISQNDSLFPSYKVFSSYVLSDMNSWLNLVLKVMCVSPFVHFYCSVCLQLYYRYHSKTSLNNQQ